MPKVKMYTTATCVYCRAQKRFFDEQGVKYEEAKVDQDQAALQEMVGLSGQYGVPFTVVTKDDGSRVGVLGFDQQQLSQLLGL
jgi:glutaredoxin